MSQEDTTTGTTCKHRIWSTIGARIEGRGAMTTGVVQECASCGALRFQERELVEEGNA